MTEQIFSWATLLTIVGLVGFYFAGKKKWWCWYINIGCQALWFTYAIVTEQYAFIAASVAYTWVFTKNAVAWTKDRYLELDRLSEPMGHVEKIVENAEGISIQFRIDNSSFVDGMRKIQEATITGTSLIGPASKKRRWWRWPRD